MGDQLGTLLRRLRKQSGLTQERLAERSGVSVSTIRRLETGSSRDHRLGTLSLLADALEIGPEERRQLLATPATTQSDPSHTPPEPVTVPPARVAEALDPTAAQRQPPPTPDRAAPPILSAAADELAIEVRRRWQREEEHRRVHDPFPLPVRWQEAPALLTDHSENIQRLPPGATSYATDLTGDLGSVAEVYRRISSGRLVVLGRAGSGKSILAIRFVLDFLKTRAPADRVPVIFTLGSWDPTTVALRDWLIDRLVRDHPHLARTAPGGATLAAALVDADLVLPVLDGFDETAESLRSATLQALNDTSLPLLLTSRADEFAKAVKAVHAPLVWAAGIQLTDLTRDNLLAYLPRTARPIAGGDSHGRTGAVWDFVLAQLRAREETEASVNLVGVLSTPLMVALARTMYSETPDRDTAELLDTERFPAERSLEEHLLAGFVPTVYRRGVPERAVGRRRKRNWDPEHAERWLAYLAHHMVRLKRQDLAWWRISESLRRSTRVMIVVAVSGLCAAAADGLSTLLLHQVTFGRALVRAAFTGSIAGLTVGTVYAIMIALGNEIIEPAPVRLRLPGTGTRLGRRTVRTFIARFGTALLGGFVLGVGNGWSRAVQGTLYRDLPLPNGEVMESILINMLVFELIFGVGGGLVFGLLALFEAPLDAASAATPVSLLASNRATVSRQVLFLAPMLTLVVVFGGSLTVHLFQGFLEPSAWGVSDGLRAGAVYGFAGSLTYALLFTAWGQWVVFSRIWLPLTGKLPWDTDVFLDDAYRRGVLRQVGAVYQFRHIRLQHHLGRLFLRRRATYAPARFGRKTRVS
ncbi:helix-turn-helix domain-containing protein [Streptomyces sp. NBC_01363]|uniref:helix-turn-helix domain-containing protein n=1 Tax=Streptomyces sp. NBC_01363 TaxID=2903840 RepID=UPI00224D98D1|nr:helix-turn-helix domain-containing protein [Streptomyces sp. NBC_01363]MCX4729469.1 helix-turn-helix domain-containing protein [Streptomyces sp. NBC_01363]MCX4736885.1 helix-turn-helix domain-containing protein [Streptomyces sp. NBC_01363]